MFLLRGLIRYYMHTGMYQNKKLIHEMPVNCQGTNNGSLSQSLTTDPDLKCKVNLDPYRMSLGDLEGK